MPTNNREALLVGARQCLYEKGYARTTARDIATAAGVSLAAIGYHYGSTEALMNAAIMTAMDEWGAAMGRTLATAIDPSLAPLERFEAAWSAIIGSLEHDRPLWIATFEVLLLSERVPEVRRFLADAIQEGIRGLAELFQGLDSTAEPHVVWTIGSFYQALMSGVMVQWMLDPDRAPAGHDLAEALRLISGGLNMGMPRPPARPDAATPNDG